MSHCSDVVEDATKKTPHRCASGSLSFFPPPQSVFFLPFSVQLLLPSSLSFNTPQTYLQIDPGAGHARKGHMGVGSRMLLRIQAVRDMCWEGRGRESLSWRSCHYSGRES